MAGKFDPDEAMQLLAECHRRCCVCHRFCGSKIELDHMVTGAEGGGDTIDNAIPLCFDCHAEVHSYNDKHPRGRKFRPQELRKHKEQWLAICKAQPSVFDGAAGRAAAGPLEAMLEEMEFNLAAASVASQDLGCPLHDEQFRRAIAAGSITLLDAFVRDAVLAAYVAIGRANQHIENTMRQVHLSNAWGATMKRAQEVVPTIIEPLRNARRALREYLGGEAEPDPPSPALQSDPPPSFEEQSRTWFAEARHGIEAGHGNVVVVDQANQAFAEWAVEKGLMVRDPLGDGVTLPGLVPTD